MSVAPAPETKPKASAVARWLPLGLFAAFFVLVIVGLYWPADREVVSGRYRL